MAAQLVVEGEARGIGRVQLDRVVSGNSECLAISREGVVRDWVVEEVVYLRSGHGMDWQEFSLLPVVGYMSSVLDTEWKVVSLVCSSAGSDEAAKMASAAASLRR